MAEPEKLSLWDRFFNRYKKIIKKEGSETWEYYYSGIEFKRCFVEYLIIDRLTGSETIEKEYL